MPTTNFLCGLVLPLPSPTAVPPTVEQLRQAREWTGGDTLRMNMPMGCDYHQRLGTAHEAGLDTVALFDLPPSLDQIAEYGAWVSEVTEEGWHLGLVARELGSEPLGGPDAHHTPEDYARFVLSVEADGNPYKVPTYIAGEVMDFSRGVLHDYHQRMLRLLGKRPVAVHPYRDPKPWWWSEYDIYGGQVSGGGLDFRCRDAEWLVLQRALGGLAVPFMVTEVGWRLSDHCSPEQQRDNLRGEMAFWRSIPTCRGVCIYQLHAPAGEGHGIIDEATWQPRPAAIDLFR